MQKNTAMKICAAFAMLVLSLPLIATFEAISFKEISFFRLLAYYVYSILPISFGYILYKLRLSLSKPKAIFLTNILIVLSAAFFAAVSVIAVCIYKDIAQIKGNEFTIVLELVPSSLLWFYLGVKLNKKSFSDVFTFIWLGIYIAETFLCYILASTDSENNPALSVSKQIMAYQLIVMAMLTVLLINQANIETQINQRKNTNLIVPKGLRRYNAKLISVVGVTILLALLLKNKIADLFSWLAVTTIKLIDYILMGIKLQQQTTPILPDSDIPLGTDTLLPDDNRVDFTIYIILIITIILVIVFRKQIVSFVKSVGERIFGKFSKNSEKKDNDLDYVDFYQSIEIVKPVNIIEKQTAGECLKAYKKETDKTKKYRIGYKLYLMWTKERSKKLTNACTVNQQQQISKEIYHGENNINAISDCYTNIRYNDSIPSENNIEEMDSFINELF